MRRGLTAVLALALVGCAEKHWTRPNTNVEQFSQDSYECAQKWSMRETEFRLGIGGGYQDEVRVNKEMYRACMMAKGYQRVEGGPFVGIRD